MSQQLINQIFELCIIPLLGILTGFIVVFIRKKIAETITKTDNELYKKYLNLLNDTICSCVIATNQTYVDALKKAGSFGKEEQLIAFNATKDAVLSILSTEAKQYLKTIIGDLDTYINQLIEAEVKELKTF